MLLLTKGTKFLLTLQAILLVNKKFWCSGFYKLKRLSTNRVQTMPGICLRETFLGNNHSLTKVICNLLNLTNAHYTKVKRCVLDYLCCNKICIYNNSFLLDTKRNILLTFVSYTICRKNHVSSNHKHESPHSSKHGKNETFHLYIQVPEIIVLILTIRNGQSHCSK